MDQETLSGLMPRVTQSLVPSAEMPACWLAFTQTGAGQSRRVRASPAFTCWKSALQ